MSEVLHLLSEGNGSCDTWTPDLCDPGLLLFLLPLRVGGLLLIFSYEYKTKAWHVNNYVYLNIPKIKGYYIKVETSVEERAVLEKKMNQIPICYKE